MFRTMANHIENMIKDEMRIKEETKKGIERKYHWHFWFWCLPTFLSDNQLKNTSSTVMETLERDLTDTAKR